MVEKWYKQRFSSVLMGLKWSKSGTKNALLRRFGVESGQYLVRNSIFSHSVKLMQTESSRDPQTYCERLTRDRSFVLHARLVRTKSFNCHKQPSQTDCCLRYPFKKRVFEDQQFAFFGAVQKDREPQSPASTFNDSEEKI